MNKVNLHLFDIVIYTIVSIFAVCCLIPFILVLSGSLSTETDIINYGYSIIPKHITFLSYRILLMNPYIMLNSYKITVIVTVSGTLLALLVNTMMAYSLSRKGLPGRNMMSFYTLFTILFSGGMVPWYIVCVNYLHLKDKIIAMILPYLVNGWYIFLLRNFIQTLPEEMRESAKIDGAGEFTIFLRIVLPLMKPALATIGLFLVLNYWNDWWLGLMLIDKTELKPLQLMLRVIVSNVDFMRQQMNSPEMRRIAYTLPAEGLKMAVCVVTIGPIVFLYPFVQKYFVKGITMGAVKG